MHQPDCRCTETLKQGSASVRLQRCQMKLATHKHRHSCLNMKLLPDSHQAIRTQGRTVQPLNHPSTRTEGMDPTCLEDDPLDKGKTNSCRMAPHKQHRHQSAIQSHLIGMAAPRSACRKAPVEWAQAGWAPEVLELEAQAGKVQGAESEVLVMETHLKL